jgi:small-conductance mechanosensitive channel
MADGWWNDFLIAIAVAGSIAVVQQIIIWAIAKVAGRKVPWIAALYPLLVRRIRLAVVFWALFATLSTVTPLDDLWWPLGQRVFLIGLILSLGYVLAGLSTFGLSRVMQRYADDGDPDDPATRRITTQVQLIKRLVNVVIAVLSVGLALFTFPQVQSIGAGLLASAGLLSVVGALAAQSALGNLFAGIQLAFSNAIRVGDVVVVEGEWGRIGEITLSYVVVNIWDERRLIVPSVYFTSKHFETWTRNSPQVLGVVMVDLDWRVPLADLRAYYDLVLAETELWDGRVSNVLVVDATGGYVRVRFLASASDSSKQWDLRCLIREKIVEWVQTHHPDALPVTRIAMNEK